MHSFIHLNGMKLCKSDVKITTRILQVVVNYSPLEAPIVQQYFTFKRRKNMNMIKKNSQVQNGLLVRGLGLIFTQVEILAQGSVIKYWYGNMRLRKKVYHGNYSHNVNGVSGK